jgi:hypothetical protein
VDSIPALDSTDEEAAELRRVSRSVAKPPLGGLRTGDLRCSPGQVSILVLEIQSC